jgi:hypothetical protein
MINFTDDGFLIAMQPHQRPSSPSSLLSGIRIQSV